MNRLVAAIEQHHSVTADQVAVARTGRNRLFDSVVLLLFLPIYMRFARPACRLVGSALPAGALFLGGMFLFWIVAAWSQRAYPYAHEEPQDP